MEIRHFITFKSIVEQGSFTKAAQALNYAQSSVTSHVQAIEEFYAQPVFDRIGKRVTLNPFGELVYKRACTLLDSYSDIQKLKDEVDKPSGTLRLGTPESTMIYRLAPILRQYKAKYPNVDIVMQNTTCQRMRQLLRQGELDLGVLLEPVKIEPDLKLLPLVEEPMSIVLPKDYPADDIIESNRHVILYTEQGCSYRTLFQNVLEKKGVSTSNIIETSNVEVIKQYVLCNIGISFLPTVVIQKELDTGQLKHIPWKSKQPVTIQLAYHKDKWLSPAMEAFIQHTVMESKQW